MNNKTRLLNGLKELTDTILNYESDTFSAEVSHITEEEAENIATAFIMSDMFNRISMNTMDGEKITHELQDLREQD